MFYPTIRSDTVLTFNVVVQSLEKDPNYLDHPECPYDDTTKTFFRKLTHPVPVDMFEGRDDVLVMDEQIQQVLNDLEQFGSTLTAADHSEKLAYFKTKTMLVEKLISMKERVLNLKETNEFRQVIVGFMDEVCSKDQITDLMHRLDGILGTSND